MELLAIAEPTRQALGIVAMGMFIGLMIGVLIYTFRRKNRSQFERAARLPLEDRPPTNQETLR